MNNGGWGKLIFEMDTQSYLQVSQALCAKNSDSKNSN